MVREFVLMALTPCFRFVSAARLPRQPCQYRACASPTQERLPRGPRLELAVFERSLALVPDNFMELGKKRRPRVADQGKNAEPAQGPEPPFAATGDARAAMFALTACPACGARARDALAATDGMAAANRAPSLRSASPADGRAPNARARSLFVFGTTFQRLQLTWNELKARGSILVRGLAQLEEELASFCVPAHASFFEIGQSRPNGDDGSAVVVRDQGPRDLF
jgi:hypothetical protein